MMTSIISSRWPDSAASSTGSSASSRSWRSSASRWSMRSGTSPESETIMIGNSEKLNSSIEYCSKPSGKSASALDMRSRTSASVAALSQPNSNSSTTLA